MQLMHVNKVFQIDNFVIQRFCSDKEVGGYYAGECQSVNLQSTQETGVYIRLFRVSHFVRICLFNYSPMFLQMSPPHVRNTFAVSPRTRREYPSIVLQVRAFYADAVVDYKNINRNRNGCRDEV